MRAEHAKAVRAALADRDEGSLMGHGVSHGLRQRTTKAGVEAFTTHDLRRTYIGGLLDEGADMSLAQDLVGPRAR